jgi:hypothetical protein
LIPFRVTPRDIYFSFVYSILSIYLTKYSIVVTVAVANMTPAPAFNLTDLDHQLLAMSDEEFVYHDWEDLKDIIGMSLSIFSTLGSPHAQQPGMISAPSGGSLPICADI